MIMTLICRGLIGLLGLIALMPIEGQYPEHGMRARHRPEYWRLGESGDKDDHKYQGGK